MYNSTFSQVQNALQGDMNNFPTELTACSSTNPCILLNDTTTVPVYAAPPPYGNTSPPATPFCLDVESHPYIIFAGLNLYQAGVQTFTAESYNDLISIFPLTNSSLSQPLSLQTAANLTPNTVSCFCPQPIFDDLYQIPVFLDQDFNDIGHYDIWDGNLGQKDIFSNFIVTATTAMGNKIQVYNTTDFGYYKTYQDSPYTIDWGDCNCNCPVPPCLNAFGDPCCETLQFPNLTNPTPHTYAGIGTRRITITHQNEWGPTSVSQVITVPFMPYNTLEATGGIPPSAVPLIGPNGPVGTSTYFGAYPFSPLDSGTDILQYSGMSPIFAGGNNSNCYEVTGNTQSLLGAFQTYTSLQTGNLPPGYQINVDVPLMGDVINPLTTQIEQGVMGRIIEENTQYTAYTISIGTNTPITFYDFYNGVTLYEGVSCGLDAFAFGAFDCVKCEIGDCTYCETKDEYIDRITSLPESIAFVSGTNTNWGEWTGTTNYIKGDIVFDATWGDCCCYMAVKDINQTGSTIDPWAGIKPTDMVQGVWWNNGQPAEHIWEACTPECEACPDFTSIPCYDPTNTWNYTSGGTVGPAHIHTVGNTYITGQFILGQWGNCYRALSGGTLPSPTGLTNNQYWDYIGCSSWVCPPVSALTASSVACELVPGTGATSVGPCTTAGFTAYEDCMDAFYLGNCCEDRFICVDQYSCQGCTAMTSNHPLYNHPSALDPNQGPVFDSMNDCMDWCEPPAYSCVTSTPQSGGNCCGLLSCNEDSLNGTTYYIDNVYPVMSTLPATPTPFLNFIDYAAFNFELFFAPYTMGDCNSGFSIPAGTYTGCCEYTKWVYNCEEGCVEVFVGTGYTTEFDCYQANPQWLGVGNTPCGYDCPVPCEGCVTAGTLSAPYTYDAAGLLACEMNCSCATECYICDCYNNQGGLGNATCILYTDPVTGAYSCPYWPPDPYGNPPTFYDQATCLTACSCSGGWDCFVYAADDPSQNISAGDQYSGCHYYASLYLMQMQGVTWSPTAPTDPDGNPTGYTSFEECCNATECCWVECENDITVAGYLNWTAHTTTGPALQGGGGGTIPCYWVNQPVPDFVGPGFQTNCCSPAYTNSTGGFGLAQCALDWPNLPYCDMVDCVNALCPDPMSSTGMTCCEPLTETCICACDTWIAAQGLGAVQTWSGPWSNMETYGLWDTVTYGDANTADCCWICTCDYSGGFVSSGMYDCNDSPPDDGDYPNGQANCWVSCERLPAYDPATPTPVIGDPCGPCDGPASGQTYECTTSGCVSSNCVYNPPGGFNISQWQTQNNCYTASTCGTPLIGINNDQCRADCYCADPGPPSGLEATEVSNCTVLQDYLNDLYSPGTGDLGIYFNGYSPFPFTYPPVQPGIVFNFTSSYFWPYDSLNTCQTQLATGMFDCCTGGTGTTTWECDSTCNCPTQGGNPCIGGVGCYPVNGTGGTFTTLTGCQEWCTWVCNSNGAQTCQFDAMSTAAVTYPSAAACELANPQCLCNAIEEWWCDWAGADIGIYDTPGSQPCQPSSFFALQGGSYQTQAIGQGALGPADPNNNYNWAITLGNMPSGQGFPNQAACEAACRFCCDCAPPGTGECELCGNPSVLACSWGSLYCSGTSSTNTQACPMLLSAPSPGDCGALNTANNGSPTCEEPQTEYCCHPVDGCLSYIGTAPLGSDNNPCVTFFGTNAAACTNDCNFVCGDCVQPFGDCHCQFVNGPVVGQCSPYPFNSLPACETYVAGLTLLGDAGSCCKCYECVAGNPITYQMYDSGSGTWVVGSTNAVMTTGALAWVPMTNYNIGDVVSFIFDGDECCYVCVSDVQNTAVDPYFYYQAYVNDVSGLIPVWPGGGSGTLVWIPCDVGCVPGVGITTYDCIPGSITDSCASLSLVVPPTTLLDGWDFVDWYGNPNTIPYLQTTNITTIKFPFGGFSTSYSDPCLHTNGLPLAQAGSSITIHSNTATVLGINQHYQSWSSMISALAGAGLTNSSGVLVSLSDDADEICDAINLVPGSHPQSSNDIRKCIMFQPDPCHCTQDPCSCLLVNGPTGALPDLATCQALIAPGVNPCCGTWICDGVDCNCVFQPNVLGGFSSQTDCWAASNCCEVPEPEYLCEIKVPGDPALNIPDLCECEQVPPGTPGAYTGPFALFDCENDPTTCCSGTTWPERWKCTKDCNCISDPYGPYATLHECQTMVNNNCCYTGVTDGWECVNFGPPTGCDCVPVYGGAWTSKTECEAQVNDCCYTGSTNYDCVPGNNGLCKCIQNQFGFYTSLFNCENSIPGPTNCCETQSGDCKDDCSKGNISPTYIEHDGTYNVGFTQTYSLSSANILGLWLSGTYYNLFDTVKDPYDDCCYVLVLDGCHFTGSDIMNYSPSQVYQNHLMGLFYNGTTTPMITPEQQAQNRGPVWWPCDPDCPVPPPDTGYDCKNCPGPCNCVINNTASAMYTGPMALANCLANCNSGCDDCATNLAGYLSGPMDYEGMWTAAFSPAYVENDCVTDPADGCCYCCVRDNTGPALCTPSTPPQMCPWGQTWQPFPICQCTSPHSHSLISSSSEDDGPGGPTGPGPTGSGPGGSGPASSGTKVVCKSYYQPSLNVGVNIGGNAMWMDCKIQTNGDPCTGTTSSVDCNNCDNYMATNWGAVLPLTWKSVTMQHFDKDWCVHDPNDNCCYCCMESPTGDPAIFGHKWVPDTPQTAPCAIYDMNQDGIWEYYGSNYSTPTTNVYYGWVSCSPTGAFPCSGNTGTVNYACKNQPIFGNPGNMVCMPDPTGPYTSLVQCQNSPCPPIVIGPCIECCEKVGSAGNVQVLPTTANPCDCATWLGAGWTSASQVCPPPTWWDPTKCMCQPPINRPDDPTDGPCVQTEMCADNYYWDWVECGCVLRTEPCTPKKCRTGEVWNSTTCMCEPIGIPDIPTEYIG